MDVDPLTAAVYRIGVEAFVAMSSDEQVQFARENLIDGDVHRPELVTDYEAREAIVTLPTGVLGGWVLVRTRSGRKAHIPVPAFVWCVSGHPNEVVQEEDWTWTATKAVGFPNDIRSDDLEMRCPP